MTSAGDLLAKETSEKAPEGVKISEDCYRGWYNTTKKRKKHQTQNHPQKKTTKKKKKRMWAGHKPQYNKDEE